MVMHLHGSIGRWPSLAGCCCDHAALLPSPPPTVHSPSSFEKKRGKVTLKHFPAAAAAAAADAVDVTIGIKVFGGSFLQKDVAKR
mmetsp:Transcript_59555/g.145967  ORF Transcript_59555/g.145967 Transcript_59555/m.145967 type:complete len:85 (-) Transcript_59555:48-302(-)